jgi:Fe-S-cluster containining protein
MASQLVTIQTGRDADGQIERESAYPGANLRQQMAEGLFYTHMRLSQNTNRLLEASAFLYGLVELLSEKGLISIEDLDQRKKAMGERLAAQLKEKGLGVMLQDSDEDKYSFQSEVSIDCGKRVHLCRASCCRLRFALSRQDIYEGMIRWDLGQPYFIAHDRDGYCTHIERGTCHCTVRENRPIPCRGYDCRNDRRIWLDFENKVINPNIQRADWPQCEASREEQLQPQ